MDFDADNIPVRRPSMVAAGHWRDVTINDSLDRAAGDHPDRMALTAVRFDGDVAQRFTYGELAALVDRVALGLHRLGVRSGDVVAVQMPNWWEFTVSYLACARIGAVMNPLMHIFRERELEFMLNHGEAVVAIVPAEFRGHDFAAMYDAVRKRVPSLRSVVHVGGDGDDSYDRVLANASLTGQAASDPAVEEILTAHRPGPDDITQLIYTSGTTGEPKGAMHTANTLYSNIIPYAERLGLDESSVVLMASPMAHQTGFMYGLMMPIVLGASAVILDVWDPGRAVSLINEHDVTFTMASTPFLADLSTAVGEGPDGVPSLETFLCAGAPIPGPLVERSQQALEATIVSAWGMSENGAVTTTLPDDDPTRSVETDGCPLPGVELRVVDEDGVDLAVGQPGRLLVRGCSNFGGYLKRPELNATDDHGWFDTGDLARLDDEGYVRITGRSKDVIIRGGENIPVVEIESLLHRHPAIAQVAIVAYPDERLGERACAIVATNPDTELSFADMIDFLTTERVAKNYLPERLVVLDAMPTTPSGKIQKFKLRELIADSVPPEASRERPGRT